MATVLPFERPKGDVPGRLFARAVVHSLVERAAEITRIPREEIFGPMKRQDACMARFAVILVARESARSWVQIGRVLGGRDHTTIMAGHRRAVGLEKSDPEFAELVRLLREEAAR